MNTAMTLRHSERYRFSRWGPHLRSLSFYNRMEGVRKIYKCAKVLQLTRINSRNIKVHHPRMASLRRVSLMWLKKLIHDLRNSFELLWMPKRLLIWPLPTVRAAAMVNPVVTGTEMKRISTPRFSKPSTNMMHPERKQSRTAKSGLPFMCGLTIIDIIAVGPVEEDDAITNSL